VDQKIRASESPLLLVIAVRLVELVVDATAGTGRASGVLLPVRTVHTLAGLTVAVVRGRTGTWAADTKETPDGLANT